MSRAPDDAIHSMVVSTVRIGGFTGLRGEMHYRDEPIQDELGARAMRQIASVSADQDATPLDNTLPAPARNFETHAAVTATSLRHADSTSPQEHPGRVENARVYHHDGAMIDLVRETWAEILDLVAVEPDDDFFDLGGNSLNVASALARLGERIGIDLPPHALFEAPTPIEMAELIAELRDKQENRLPDGITPFFPNWVVPLQREGAGRPVFVFPGGGGEIELLTNDAQVAALVGRHHPFWGFMRGETARTQGSEDGIPQLAAEYVTQMRKIQWRGPFLLYGICSGGSLAWEAARQLLASGEAIAGILFYEVPLHHGVADLMPVRTPSSTASYRPPALPVDLSLLMTEAWHARGRSAGWQHLTSGTLETIIMPGDSSGGQRHRIYAGRKTTIAKHVRTWIEKSEARLRNT